MPGTGLWVSAHVWNLVPSHAHSAQGCLVLETNRVLLPAFKDPAFQSLVVILGEESDLV